MFRFIHFCMHFAAMAIPNEISSELDLQYFSGEFKSRRLSDKDRVGVLGKGEISPFDLS